MVLQKTVLFILQWKQWVLCDFEPLFVLWNPFLQVKCVYKALGFFVLTGLSPDLQSMEQIRRIMRPTDVPDTGE